MSCLAYQKDTTYLHDCISLHPLHRTPPLAVTTPVVSLRFWLPPRAQLTRTGSRYCSLEQGE